MNSWPTEAEVTASAMREQVREQVEQPADLPFPATTMPLYLPTDAGVVFTLSVTPPATACPKHWVLYCPPLAEEMNKSRAMVMLQARQMAQAGCGVLIPDYAGTGDSPGEFEQVCWDQWRKQMVWLLNWLAGQGAESVSLWGLRLGALMAVDVMTHYLSRQQEALIRPLPIERLLLWQPVASGKTWLNQFLRLRVASGIFQKPDAGINAENKAGKKESAQDLRQRLASGEVLEVAGYRISPELAEALESQQLTDYTPPPSTEVMWLEVGAQTDPKILPVSARIIDQWQQAAVPVQAHALQGDQFWMTQEISYAPGLWQCSRSFFPAQETIKPAQQTGKSPVQDGTCFSQCLAQWEKHHSRHVQQAGVEAPGLVSQALRFSCQGQSLIGVLEQPCTDPQAGSQRPQRGVVIVVGGPQYRVGSHRQFFQLSRQLAGAGTAVLRFDYRGMGDSEGDFQGFERIHDDIQAAVDTLVQKCPYLDGVVLWGLCDGATAAASYASCDERVQGLVLLNPWVRSETGQARAYIKHYYLQRVLQPELWQKIARGEFQFKQSIGSLCGSVKSVLRKKTPPPASSAEALSATPIPPGMEQDNLVRTMEQGLEAFKGELLLILSGNDLTAQEFKDALKGSSILKKITRQPRCSIKHLDKADHTFSSLHWKRQVSQWTQEWLTAW